MQDLGPQSPCLTIVSTCAPDSAFEAWRDEALFGGELRTYLVVDATLRKNVQGAFDLDQLDVPCACLFDGDAASEFAEAAPYIMDITPPTDPDARRPKTISGYLDQHWGQGTGIILRSAGTLDDIKKHLRYFLRLKREDTGGWVLFRFWDVRVALPYFEYLTQQPARSASWFFPDPDPLLAQIVIEGGSPDEAWIVTPAAHLLREAAQRGRPRRTDQLRAGELTALGAISAQLFYQDASTEMVQHVTPDSAYGVATPKNRQAYLTMVGRFAEAQGFTSRQAIAKLGLLSLMLGVNFLADKRYSSDRRDAINRTPASETERLMAARDLFDEVKPKFDADGGAAAMQARIHLLVRDGQGGGPATVLRRIAPAQLGTLDEAQLTSLVRIFFHRYPQVRSLPEAGQRAAVAMMAAFGGDWPSHPLYSNVWLALFEPDWQPRLVNLLAPNGERAEI